MVDDQTIDHFYQGEKIFVDKEEVIITKSICDVDLILMKKTALARFLAYKQPLVKAGIHSMVSGTSHQETKSSPSLLIFYWTQVFYCILIGAAGCGKTLLAVAAGLEQVLEEGSQEPITINL